MNPATSVEIYSWNILRRWPAQNALKRVRYPCLNYAFCIIIYNCCELVAILWINIIILWTAKPTICDQFTLVNLEIAVNRCDIQGNSKRNENKWGEGYPKWHYRFSESWGGFGIDGTFRKWKDDTPKSAWWQVEAANCWWLHYLQWPALLQVPKKQVRI